MNKEEKKIKGVLLCGGTGSRLYPLTKSINKHLLPVCGKPMAQWAIEEMSNAGIKDILIVSGQEHCGSIISQFGDGSEYGCSLTYKVQSKAGGIAQALLLAEDFIGDDYACVILGDNIFDFGENGFKKLVIDNFTSSDAGSEIVTFRVKDPTRFGVLSKDSDGNYTGIEEKPENPSTDLAVIGIYMYDSKVFDIIKTLKPSKRGELEITDVNNSYLRRNDIVVVELPDNVFWSDAGTHASYSYVNKFFKKQN